MQPYRIKVIEPLTSVTRSQRKQFLEKSSYNLFKIPAKYVYLDFISDSGTGAMSINAWAEMMRAREDFSGQEAHETFVRTAVRLTRLPYIQPVHQGRAAESLLFRIILRQGDTVLSNAHFESTRKNIEALGCKALDLTKPEPPFCGNLDLEKFHKHIKTSEKIKMLIMTLTNNIKGGQPVSLENIVSACHLAKRNDITVIFDASRFADNAFLIKDYTRSRLSVTRISREMFKYCDIVYMSSKKDGLVNIGGFIGLRKKRIYEELRRVVIAHESYPTSGGLSARDLAAMAVSMEEAVDERFLRAHIGSIRYLGSSLKEMGVKIFEPIGGHGVVILPAEEMPNAAYALGAEIYLQTGIRCGIFGKELRIAVPRRVYSNEQLLYAAESIAHAYHGKQMKLALKNRPRDFFNFFAEFRRVT